VNWDHKLGVPGKQGDSQLLLRSQSDFPRSTFGQTSSHFQKIRATMADDMDMMAMMGITGFGKQTKKRELDPRRFEKNRREEVMPWWAV